MITFNWNESKNQTNRKKHGVWFEEAQSVFDSETSRLFLDSEHLDQEERFILIGFSKSERLLVVVHCYQEDDDLIRIISARKATRKERAFYEKGI